MERNPIARIKMRLSIASHTVRMCNFLVENEEEIKEYLMLKSRTTDTQKVHPMFFSREPWSYFVHCPNTLDSRAMWHIDLLHWPVEAAQ